MTLSAEDREEMEWLLRHRSFKHIMRMVDELVGKIQNEIMTIPIESDPQAAALVLYGSRRKAEGAICLRNALKNKIDELTYRKEGDRR